MHSLVSTLQRKWINKLSDLKTWLEYWLPFIQGFAALASIGGALLSWKYALKAERIKRDMISNVLLTKMLEDLESSCTHLQIMRESASEQDGSANESEYLLQKMENKRVLEKAFAVVVAAAPTLREIEVKAEPLRDALLKASFDPSAPKIDACIKHLCLINEILKVKTTARAVISIG
jgi:hypothetical protein